MNNRMLLLWLAGGAGVVLLYAAYKGKSPSDVLTGYATVTKLPAQASTPVPVGPGTETSGNHPVSADFTTTDANGLTVDIPAAYAASPDLFIPSRNMN